MKHILLLFILILMASRSFCQNILSFKEANIPFPKFVDTIVEQWSTSQKEYTSLSADGQSFFYWVNYSRANPKRFYDSAVIPILAIYPQLNGDYSESLKTNLNDIEKLPLLSLNGDIIKMSQLHANDIVSHKAKPSHNSTNGDSFSDRFKKLNLQACGGENVSFGKANMIFLLTLLYLDVNVQELGHRKALLNAAYTQTGIGLAHYTDGNIFLVEDFACAKK